MKEDRSKGTSWTDPLIVDAWWREFQDAYPHKAGLAKARDMFCKVVLTKGASTAERERRFREVMAGVERYIEDLAMTGQAPANSMAWLHGERWHDEIGGYRDLRQSVVVPAQTPAPASEGLPPANPPSGVLITETWIPSALSLEHAANAGWSDEEVRDVIRDYRQKMGGKVLKDPDAEFLTWLSPF